MAIDLVLIPYHGEHQERIDEVYRSQPKVGTSYFHAGRTGKQKTNAYYRFENFRGDIQKIIAKIIPFLTSKKGNMTLENKEVGRILQTTDNVPFDDAEEDATAGRIFRISQFCSGKSIGDGT